MLSVMLYITKAVLEMKSLKDCRDGFVLNLYDRFIDGLFWDRNSVFLCYLNVSISMGMLFFN